MTSVLALVLLAVADVRATELGGRDNAEFVRALQKAGYPDLARQFVDVVAGTASLDAAEHVALRSAGLDVRLQSIGAIKEVDQRLVELEEIVAGKEKLAKELAGTPEGEALAETLPDVYRVLGETMVAALERTEDPQVAVDLRDRGNKAFFRAEEIVRKRARAFDEKSRDIELDDAAAEEYVQKSAVEFYILARTEYFHALLFGAGDPQRKIRMQEALRSFTDFCDNHNEMLFAYEGLMFQGLIQQDLGQVDLARDLFDQAIALRAVYEQKAGKYEITDGFAQDIVASAVLQKMKLLAGQNDVPGAVAAADEYFATSQKPLEASQGFNILIEKAEALLKSGDSDGARAAANQLVEADPDGPWGDFGTSLLNQIGGGGATNLEAGQQLKLARTLVGKREFDDAIRYCRHVLAAGGNSPTDRIAAADALMISAACYTGLGDPHAAAVAYMTVAADFSDLEVAPQALWQSILASLDLYKAERRTLHDQRLKAQMQELATKYPTHPLATRAQLIEGRRLQDDQKFLEAAEFFDKVAPGTPGHAEAQFQSGRCVSLEIERRLKANGDAAALVGRAEGKLKAAIIELDRAAENTLNLSERDQFDRLSFEARTTLAGLLLSKAANRAAEVPALLDDVEKRFGEDADRIAPTWALRIRAYDAAGKLAEAQQQLEALSAKSPGAPSTALAAGTFARSLDARAIELMKTPASQATADDLWKKAFRWYVVSIEPKLGDAAAARDQTLENVANRFVVFGLHFNGVPQRLVSFVGWDGKLTAPEYFEQAVRTYEAAIAMVPRWSARLSFARCQGFLGRWQEAAQTYARIFDDEKVLDLAKKELDKSLTSAKPELVAACLEWGVAEFRAGVAAKDAERLRLAMTLCDTTVKSARRGEENWWQSRWHQLQSRFELGEYQQADIMLRDTERTTSNDFDQNKYGLRKGFLDLKAELARKLGK